MTYSETIREILKKRSEWEQLQEQILLEFPKKVNAIDVNWLEQFSFNSGYFEKIMERKELLSPFKFDKYDGFSDHTIGMYWARESLKRGAKIIEKHFTLDKKLPGHNQEGSCDPSEAKDLVQFIRQYERGGN